MISLFLELFGRAAVGVATGSVSGSFDQQAGRDAVREMLTILDSADPLLRARIVWSLGRLEDQRAVPALIPLLGELRSVDGLQLTPAGISIDPDLRGIFTFSEAAAQSLRGLGEMQFVEAFLQALTKDVAPIPILKQSSQAEIVAAFLRAIDSDCFPESGGAAWTLAQLRAVEAVPELRSRMSPFSSASDEVRQACAETIAALEATAGLPRPRQARAIRCHASQVNTRCPTKRCHGRRWTATESLTKIRLTPRAFPTFDR